MTANRFLSALILILLLVGMLSCALITVPADPNDLQVAAGIKILSRRACVMVLAENPELIADFGRAVSDSRQALEQGTIPLGKMACRVIERLNPDLLSDPREKALLEADLNDLQEILEPYLDVAPQPGTTAYIYINAVIEGVEDALEILEQAPPREE